MVRLDLVKVKIGCFGTSSLIDSVERVEETWRNDDLDILIYVKKKM